MLEAVLLFYLIKGLHHETTFYDSQRLEKVVQCDGSPYPSEKYCRCEHGHARRDQAVNDALLQALKRLSGPITDEEREAQDRLFDLCGVP